MNLFMMKCKIHRAIVTESVMHYEGSMGIDRDLMDAVGLLPHERIDVLNVNNGERFTTYVIEEPRGCKTFGVYGAAAHKAKAGDVLIIIAYAQMDEKEAKSYHPKVIVLNEKNEIAERKEDDHDC